MSHIRSLRENSARPAQREAWGGGGSWRPIPAGTLGSKVSRPGPRPCEASSRGPPPGTPSPSSLEPPGAGAPTCPNLPKVSRQKAPSDQRAKSTGAGRGRARASGGGVGGVGGGAWRRGGAGPGRPRPGADRRGLDTLSGRRAGSPAPSQRGHALPLPRSQASRPEGRHEFGVPASPSLREFRV